MNKTSWIFVILCAASGCHRSPSPDELNKWRLAHAMYDKVYHQYEREYSDFVTTGQLVAALGEPEAVVQVSELPAFFAERFGWSVGERAREMKHMCFKYKRNMRLTSDSSKWRDYPGLGENKVWFYLLSKPNPVSKKGLIRKKPISGLACYFIVQDGKAISPGEISVPLEE